MAYAKRDEKTFDLGNGLSAVAHYEKTRMAFRHLAALYWHGQVIAKAKIAYQNRTWESYTYQSVLSRLLDNAKGMVKAETLEAAREIVAHYQEPNPFAFAAKVAALGSVLTDTPKAANDWKARMLKAGMPDLDFPADFDTLPEEERQRRLDGVIKEMKQP